ncbi:MAG: ABC transporter substrate-binding protein [Clostridiaceae bacterium]|jgi:branched-chain amino acid transport system substrate-binding protein|nr:ABC transporter substrate-binding protein [Clostridiaceae bacterium]
MKNLSKILVLVLMLSIIFTACGNNAAPQTSPSTSAQPSESASPSNQPTGEPIKLGMVTQFPREYSYYVRDGVKMAVEEINAAGGVLGRPLELIIEDEGETQQDSLNAMMKLLTNKDLVGVLGSIQSPYCVAASDLVAQEKIPTLMGGSSRKIVEQGNDYIYLVRTIDKYNGANVAKLAVEKYNAKKVAIVHMNDASGVSYSEAITNTLKDKYGITPVLTLGYDEKTETNFNPYVIQAMEAEADFLFFSGSVGVSNLMQQAVYNNGFEGKCMSTTPGVSAQAVEMSGEAAENWSSVSDYSTDVDDEFQRAFIDKYKETHEFDPDFFAAEYYDMVYLFAEAIEIAGVAERDAINEGIKQIKDFQGAMSNYSFHDDYGLSNIAYVVTVKDGKPIVEDTVRTYE